ncbi:endogenous retrovirus group K member 7 Pro protein-like [Grammomys surdaster]|uniref:endogenous retrovirus group K member 7 Pro protein-like n=1 Tax=Grammomys surdaster TaxID=491861 RepID=UPI0010A0AF77|nr:endogenous retrovirus group K member 7 Pro protein-like [Grammomys surdaster]
MDLQTRPTLTLKLEGKQFSGILDTGADKSIISANWWPKAWPVTQSSRSLQGLGYEANPSVSSQTLCWEAPKGQIGTFTPYVLPLPVNLWGRDVLQQLNLRLTDTYSPQAVNMMSHMGYQEGRGLGAREQGRPDPIFPVSQSDKKGLGFS